MRKRNLILALLLIFPLVIASRYANFDTISAVFFVLVVLFLIIRNRKKLEWQKIIGIGKVPLIYAVLWRTNFGLKFMDRVAKKHRELVKLLGYIFIGFGFAGMVYISINILTLLFQLFVSPREASSAVSLVLPLTNIPGAGFLSFWHFIISLFITVLIHEFGHGILARAHDVPVKNSGLGVFSIILPIFPVAFVEPDEKKLTKSSDIVQYSIFSAGPIINVAFAMIVILLINFAVVPVENRITDPVGFSFGTLMPGYSAMESGMPAGAVINNYNGKKVLTYDAFSREAGFLKPGTTVNLGIANGTIYSLITKPAPNEPDRGYIGIQEIKNERRIKPEFSNYSGAFFWIKGLLKWVYLINLIIGLMNLLPLLITDGGRMLRTALERTVSDKKKAQKIWGIISSLFIFTILFAMFLKYIVFGLVLK